MSRTSARELLDALDMEFWLDRESIPFRNSRGRSGEQLNVESCPCCGNAKYRVYLNAESGVGNCFVCSEPFNKFSFIHTYLGNGDNQKRDTFAHIEEALRDQGWRPKRVTQIATSEEKVALPLSMELPTRDGETLNYLRDRGIDDEITRYFALRYCIDGWWNYEKPEGGRGGQNFKERVVIPVYDLEGELATFQGRDITGSSEKKYLFPMGLPGTGRYLYNGHNARNARRAAMGEGAFDVMALKIAVDGAGDLRDIVPIGSFGKHLSYGDVSGRDQLGALLELKRLGLHELILCWDGEEKALLSALDAAKLASGIGLRVRIALLPPGKDPNEVLPEITQEALRKAAPWTPQLDLQWRLRNPYAVPRKQQSILTACP